MPHRPSFLVTIDTEGDNVWARRGNVTTRNAGCLPRFQALCESYGLRPTYLTTWEMADCPDFQDFARDVIDRNTAEIGMHLHAWSTPPLEPLTQDDDRNLPYLFEYPRELMAAKIKGLTEKLRDTFGVPVTSHRAGRWGFDATYARLLVEHGYRVDCSVTPHLSWASSPGDPRRAGGPDYTGYPTTPYRLDLEDIRRPGSSPLLELPVTTFRQTQPRLVEHVRRLSQPSGFATRVVNRLFPRALWIRPNGRNGRLLPRLIDRAASEQRDYIQFMLHSSEFLPGGSPTFRSPGSVEALYADMERLFEAAAARLQGETLSEYHDRWVASSGAS
jgi:peptidoglycan/xylan/chitin deacetylase (PgdA/CDA1 family)